MVGRVGDSRVDTAADIVAAGIHCAVSTVVLGTGMKVHEKRVAPTCDRVVPMRAAHPV